MKLTESALRKIISEAITSKYSKEIIQSIWNKAKNGIQITPKERKLITLAYWDHKLPHDPDYDVSQWVEDGCPII